MLEIRIIQFMKFEWLYTRTVSNDFTRFFWFTFDDELLGRIKPFLYIPINDFSSNKAYSMVPLTTISLAKYHDDVWKEPNYDIRALVSLAYAKSQDGKDKIGLSLSPVSKISLSDGKVIEVNDNTTFQNLAEGDMLRYYIPPMLIRYKLF